jgi:cellulose synthase operon protein C
MRKLNLVFLLGVVMALLVLGGAVYLVHNRQVVRNASALLDHARKAEERGELSETSEELRRYLSLRPADRETWRWYARVLDKVTTGSGRGDELYLVYEEALRYNPGDPSLERRCVDLALELRPERTTDAKRHLRALLTRNAEKLKKDDEASAAARELAELKELEGKCLLLESDFEAAANAYKDSISSDPTRLACYVQRARIYRNELHKDPKDADDEIERMVANNPESGPAHLYRFRYASEFRPPAGDSDLKKALELAPENPAVLLTAAQVAEQKKDPAAARSYLEKGLKLHPQNADFPMALARLELQEQHLDRAETVLRRAYPDNLQASMAFLLAETLILQDKIEGSDGARVFMDYLAGRGYRETYVRCLEARIEVQEKRWDKAISKIESALAVMQADPGITTQLYLMLAECYTRLGWEEQRLDALRNAGEGPSGSEAARLALARSLAESNNLDEALAILLPLARSRPELRLEIVRLSIQQTRRQPSNQRDWRVVERLLDEARKAQPEATEALDLLRADLLAAQEKWDEARRLLTAAQSRNPHSLKYRLALSRLSERDRTVSRPLQILDQAEKDLGPNPDIRLARLAFWARRGGDEARTAVAKLAENRDQIPAMELPAFLDQLGVAEIRLEEPALARQHWRELSAIQPGNIRVLMGRFDLALAANDEAEASELVEKIRKGEGEQGTNWRFAQALELINRARRGDSTTLQAARTLASEIAARRREWWGASVLNAQIAELQNQPEQALTDYMEAVKLGNGQPYVVRRLVQLLYQRNQFEDIQRLAQLLRNRDIALSELTTLASAINALRKGDPKHGLALVLQVVSDSSPDFSDHLVLGRFYLAAGQTVEAETHFKRASELGPGVPGAWLSYVQFLVSTKQAEKARAAVAAAFKALPGGRSSLTLALCAMMIGDNDQAESQIQSVLRADSQDPAALRTAIAFYLSRGRTDLVDKYLDILLHHAPRVSADELAWARRTRATLLIRTGRPDDMDQALNMVDQNLTAIPRSVEDRRLKATILATRPTGRPEAIKILETLAGGGELDRTGRFMLAQLYLSQGQEDSYRGQMLALLGGEGVDPRHLAHYIHFLINRKDLGRVDGLLAELKRIEPRGLDLLEAEAAVLKARKQEPELLALLKARGRDIPDQIERVADLMSRYGFVREAEQAYKALIARDSGQPEGMLAFADFLARQDRVPEAMDLLKKAWVRCPPELVAYAALSLYDAPSIKPEEREQVGAWVAEAARKLPANLTLKVKLSALRIRQGRFEEAEALCRQVLETRPDDTEAMNNLAWLLAMRNQGEVPQALSLINKAIELNGSDLSLVDTRAVVFIRSGQLDRALEQLQSVQQRDSRNVGAAFHMAWAYQAKGDMNSARAKLQEAERLGLSPRSLDPLELVVFEGLRKTLGVRP